MKLPADLERLLTQRFRNLHRDWLADTGSGDWPLVIGLGVPSEELARRQVDVVRAWADAWRVWSGPGELQWTERRWRVLGTQNLPASLVLRDAAQVAAWAGEQDRWRRASDRFRLAAARWPALAQRLTRLFGVLADYPDEDFSRLLELMAWLADNPASGLYPRQIPLAGIDSKWLEGRQSVVTEIVAAVRATPIENPDFYSVCGLRRPPHLVRIRILDPQLRARTGGLSDITAPLDELVRLDLPAATVLVVENLQTGLALDDLPGTVAVLALGYSVGVLGQVPWVKTASTLYWGDIDTHGYAILHQARAALPGIRSLMMDSATFLRFAPQWGDEPQQCAVDVLDRLTAEENQMYEALKSRHWGGRRRLEQERIAWDYARPLLLESIQRNVKQGLRL